MKINVRTNDLVKMSDSARDYINERVGSLEKLFNSSENVVANVLCKGFDKYTVVEITIPLKHVILRAESKADTLYAAIDFATDKVERQLLRHKQKVNTMIKKRDGIANHFSQLETKDEIKEPVDVSKTKVIDKEVMSVDEANHRHSVVYIRKDGGYGIIETKE